MRKGRNGEAAFLSCTGSTYGNHQSHDKKTGIILGRCVRWSQREKKDRCTTRGSQKENRGTSLHGGSAEKDCGGQTEGGLGVSGWWVESTKACFTSIGPQQMIHRTTARSSRAGRRQCPIFTVAAPMATKALQEGTPVENLQLPGYLLHPRSWWVLSPSQLCRKIRIYARGSTTQWSPPLSLSLSLSLRPPPLKSYAAVA